MNTWRHNLHNLSNLSWGVLAVLTITCLTLITLPTPAQAETTETTDLNITIDSAIALTLTNCLTATDPDSTSLTLTPTPNTNSGFSSNCQTLTIDTNAPGYSLSTKALSLDNSNNLNYLNPPTLNPKPVILATSSTIATPSPLTTTTGPTGNTWGFAVTSSLPISSTPSIANFDTTYTIDNANNKYANLPTTDIEIYSTEQFPEQTDFFTYYYATRVNTAIPAGSYGTTITYTVVGDPVPEPPTYFTQVISDNNITTMQELTNTICQEADYDSANGGNNAHNTATLNDIRNNQQYQVRKMADNRCWMVNNLKLDGASVTAVKGNRTLTPADTNIAADWDIPNKVTSGYAYNNYYVYGPVSGDSSGEAGSTTSNGALDNDTFYGYLYNWCAATAGILTATTSQPGYTCTAFAAEPNDAVRDICPSNWRLPTANSVNEFAILNASMNAGSPQPASVDNYFANWQFAGAFKGVLSGYRTDSAILDQGVNGYLWSSSHVPTSYTASNVQFSSSQIGLNGYARYYGLAVRCVVSN